MKVRCLLFVVFSSQARRIRRARRATVRARCRRAHTGALTRLRSSSSPSHIYTPESSDVGLDVTLRLLPILAPPVKTGSSSGRTMSRTPRRRRVKPPALITSAKERQCRAPKAQLYSKPAYCTAPSLHMSAIHTRLIQRQLGPGSRYSLSACIIRGCGGEVALDRGPRARTTDE